jgi:hypothetical protein
MQLARRLQRLSWRHEERPLLESPLDFPLVDVPEEGRDVLARFRRLVIPHENVLPDIHYQQCLDAGGHTLLRGADDP